MWGILAGCATIRFRRKTVFQRIEYVRTVLLYRQRVLCACFGPRAAIRELLSFSSLMGFHINRESFPLIRSASLRCFGFVGAYRHTNSCRGSTFIVLVCGCGLGQQTRRPPVKRPADLPVRPPACRVLSDGRLVDPLNQRHISFKMAAD